jgi:lactate dehydrogenase-like 2-hydroxyacid dehydrogenase
MIKNFSIKPLQPSCKSFTNISHTIYSNSPYLLSGKDVFNSTIGIYGMGDIGKAFARRLQGFNTKIL